MLWAMLATSSAWASVTLSASNFPDANFRAAVAAAAHVSEGATIDEATVTELDVSGLGITNLTGVERLTALTKLVAADNNIQYVRLTGNVHLEWLDLSGNAALVGFSTSAATASNHYINLTPSSTPMPLKHLDLSDCNIGYFQAISVTYGVTTLTWLSLANDAAMAGWSPGIAAQTGLVYCDLTNTGQTSTSLAFTASHNKLETLILKNNGSWGYSSSIQYLSALKHLDVSGCDLYFRNGASPTYYLLHYLTPANNPLLETLIASNSKMGSATEGLTGFTHLKTVDISGNPNVTQFWVNGSPTLESLNISGLNKMAYLQLNDDALPRSGFSLTGAGDCTALRSLYLNGNEYESVGDAVSDFASITALAFLYLENNSGFGGKPLTLTAQDCGNLTGIDLGNNGMTAFSADALPATLTALMLGNNTSMTRLEMHNNPGITAMTASPTMTGGSGLYLLGNTALTYMDISGTAEQHNHFQRIGNNGSLNGVPIDTIKASYNKFYTFRNLSPVAGNNYERWSKSTTQYDNIVSSTPPSLDYYYYAYWPASPAMPDSASLEQLPGLKYLDLSHCQLKDSLYLHKNTELRYLDVSHNRTIARYTTSHDKGAAYRASIPAGSTFNRDFPDYKKYLWLSTNNDDREYFTGDYNDTTGLYILDLMDNDKLEYLDISYTGIEQTALTHCHVSNARYIWIQDLNNLKYFYANYNGMRSLGIGTLYGKRNREGLKSLERLSVIGMRGADDRTMQGSINFRENSVCTKLHYINLSYSRFDSIGVYAPQVDTLIIRGNPLHYVDMQTVNDITYIDARECAFKTRGYDVETGNIFYPDATRYQNGARKGGTYSGVVTTELSGLRGIRAYSRPKLTTVLLDNCNALTDVYCHHDPLLPKIHGFENLAFNKPYDSQYGFPTTDADTLRLVWVNDNQVFNELNLTKNVNLQYLHAYNDKALGTALDDDGMQLNENVILKSAWVSNSLLKKFTNNATTHLDTLKIWDNPQLKELDVTQNTKLRYFDLRNCSLRYLDMQHCDSLRYFDCSNDSIKGKYALPDWFGYQLPQAVSVPDDLNPDNDGKNHIADLMFQSKKLNTVKADNNDLYSLKGLNNIDSLKVLTYSHNHINAIDLSGSPNIQTYDCSHNGRGAFPAEYARWLVKKADNSVDTCHMYYLQLDPNAGDELKPQSHDSYLGYKWGHDSLEAEGLQARTRVFDADGFNPAMVDTFIVNSMGPVLGNRVNENSLRGNVYIGTDTVLNPDLIYGNVVVLDITNNPYHPGYHYITYKYFDGRRAPGNRDGEEPSTSTFYMVWYSPGEATDVDETLADDLGEATVVSERYYDINGREHSEPVDGVNIIVRQMSDGSTQTVKVIK